MSEKKTPTLSASQYLEQRIDEFKKANFSKGEKAEEIIGLFNYIVGTRELDKKYYFEKIYDLDKNNKIFKELNNKILGIINQEHIELLDWICEKQVDIIQDIQEYYQINIQLIKRCHKTVITDYLINRNFSSLSKEDFKDNILKPFFELNSKINYQNISVVTVPDEALFVLMSYLNKYLKKQNVFDEIKVFNSEIQTQVVNRLINKKWFDNKEIYLILKEYVETIEPENKIKIYNKIFEKERNLNYLKLFEEEFEIMFEKKTIQLSHFTNSLTDVSKRNYILERFIKNEDELNKVIDSVLIGQSQNKNRSEFNDFIQFCMQKHLTGEKKLNVDQFCIMIKRCHDYGRFDTIEELLQTLKEKDSPVFKAVYNKLQSKPILTTYGSSTMDFTKEPIQKFINYLFNKHLNAELEEKNSNQRNKKI